MKFQNVAAESEPGNGNDATKMCTHRTHCDLYNLSSAEQKYEDT